MRRIALTLAITLALSPTKGMAASFSDADAKELRFYILSLINESREKEHLPALKLHEGLEHIAELHVEDTVSHFDPATPETRERSYLAHTSSDGRSLNARFRDAKLETGWAYAENAGYWTRSPFGETMEAAKFGLRMIHGGMMAEVPPNDGHRRTILGEFTHIGIGLALLSEPEKETSNALFFVGDTSLYSTVFQPTSPRSFPRHDIPTHGGPFLDIPPSHAFATAIRSLKEKNILEGFDDGNFRPGQPVTRAEFLKMLLDAADFSPIGREFTQCFSDIHNEWFAPYVCVGKRKGWVHGYPDDTFRPETHVSRAESIALLSRIFDITPESSPTLFDDVSPDVWYGSALQALANRDVLPFPSRLFKPEKDMERGEVAEMIFRASRVRY